jgi:hypothetical protein
MSENIENQGPGDPNAESGATIPDHSMDDGAAIPSDANTTRVENTDPADGQSGGDDSGSSRFIGAGGLLVRTVETSTGSELEENKNTAGGRTTSPDDKAAITGWVNPMFEFFRNMENSSVGQNTMIPVLTGQDEGQRRNQ